MKGLAVIIALCQAVAHESGWLIFLAFLIMWCLKEE